MRGSPAAFESFLAEAREDTAKADGLRLRRRAKPPFSFSEEKENAPFDGVREKGSGGGIPDFARNARGACYGSFGPVVAGGLDHSTAYGGFVSWVPPRCSVLLFLLPHLGGCGRLVEGALSDALPFFFAAAPWHSRETGAEGILGCPLPFFCCRTWVAGGLGVFLLRLFCRGGWAVRMPE